MLKTVMALGKDWLGARGLVLSFDVPDEPFDLMAAVKAAALEYCRSKDGKETYEYTLRNFDLVDFALYVPNKICMKHGFSIIASPVADLVVDWSEQLVVKEDVYLDEDEVEEDEFGRMVDDLRLFYEAEIDGGTLFVGCWHGEDVEIFLGDDGNLMCLLPDEDEPRSLRDSIQDVEPGDAFLFGGGGSIRIASEAAHQNFDEPDNPWIVYGDDGDCYFEEDFGVELGKKMKELLEKLPARDADLIENAVYVSVWDGGHAVETACKVNRQTGEVFDVEVSDGNADGLDVLEEEYVRFADGTKCLVVDGYLDDRWPLKHYDDAVQYLCEVLNERDWEMDLDDNFEPVKMDEFVPIFKSENYFGIYVWHEDANEYYLVDRNNGKLQLVLGDSFEFVGKNTLDCMRDEKILNVANTEWMQYLVDFSLRNVEGVVPERELRGIAVLEAALREAVKKEGKFFMGQSLLERLDAAQRAAQDSNHDAVQREIPKEME